MKRLMLVTALDPLAVLTTTCTVPWTDGASARIWVLERSRATAGFEPKSTARTFVKLRPMIVTSIREPPELGETPHTTGAGGPPFGAVVGGELISGLCVSGPTVAVRGPAPGAPAFGFTVSVAGVLVAAPTELVNTARYSRALRATVVLATVSVGVVLPASVVSLENVARTSVRILALT